MTKAYLVKDSFSGEKKYKEILPDKVDTIKFVTKFGYELDVKVIKKTYKLEGRKSFFRFRRNKEHVIYELYCEMTDDFPEHIREIFSEKISFPRLLSSFISEEKQINSIVVAFLDIKLHQLNKEVINNLEKIQ